MTISTAATASPHPSQLPLQPKLRHNWPHDHTTRDHPAAWFGQNWFIFGEIVPFLQGEFCYTTAFLVQKPGRWDFDDGKLIFKAIPLPCFPLNH